MKIGVLQALTAAALFGASTPLAKLLVGDITPVMLAGLLYLGSGIGLLAWLFLRGLAAERIGESTAHLAWPDLGWLAGAILAGGVVGPILLMAGLAYSMLQREIIKEQGGESIVAHAVGADFKGKLSLVAYLAAIPLAFVNQWLAGALYVGVALTWLIPDARIARALAQRDASGDTR